MSLLASIIGNRRRAFTPLSLSPALWLDASDASTLYSGASLASASATGGANGSANDGSTATSTAITQNITAMCDANSGVYTNYNNARYGFFGAGLSVGTSSDQDSFTAAVRALWETCTGLTLP